MGRPYWDRPQGNTRGGSNIKSLKTAAGVLAVLIIVVTGLGWWMGNSVHRSWILGGARSGTTGNFLIMGLDSRLDENGTRCRPTSMTRCTRAMRPTAARMPMCSC